VTMAVYTHVEQEQKKLEALKAAAAI
jgi:hypothetical protein